MNLRMPNKFQSWICWGGCLKFKPCFVTFFFENKIFLYFTSLLSNHYDVIMSAMATEITSLTIIYSTAFSCANQIKHQYSVSLAFVMGIHRLIPRSKGQWHGKVFQLMTSWCAETSRAVGIPSFGGQWYQYCTQWVPWLVMAWRQGAPEYQQSCIMQCHYNVINIINNPH